MDLDQGSLDFILPCAITVFGFILALLSFLVILRGKRIPGERGSPQEIEYKGFKIKANIVTMLFLVSVVVLLLPFSLKMWEKKQKPKDAFLYIKGQVLGAAGPLDNARVEIIKTIPGQKDNVLFTRVTDKSGVFDFEPLPYDPNVRYKLLTSKDGHIDQNFYVGPQGVVDIWPVLTAEPR